MNQSQYAKRTQISRSTVNRLVKRGIIAVDEFGQINPEDADKALAASQHPGYDHNRRVQLPLDESPRSPDPLPGGDSHPSTTNGHGQANIEAAALHREFRTAAAEQKKYQALLAKLDYLERAGRLVDAKEQEVLAFQIYRDSRDGIQNIPQRVVGSIAAALGQDAAAGQERVYQIIDREIRDILEELSHAHARLGHARKIS